MVAKLLQERTIGRPPFTIGRLLQERRLGIAGLSSTAPVVRA
jgi:hypothetical protein